MFLEVDRNAAWYVVFHLWNERVRSFVANTRTYMVLHHMPKKPQFRKACCASVWSTLALVAFLTCSTRGPSTTCLGVEISEVLQVRAASFLQVALVYIFSHVAPAASHGLTVGVRVCPDRVGDNPRSEIHGSIPWFDANSSHCQFDNGIHELLSDWQLLKAYVLVCNRYTTDAAAGSRGKCAVKPYNHSGIAIFRKDLFPKQCG